MHTWLLASRYLSLCIFLWNHASNVCVVCTPSVWHINTCTYRGLLYELVRSVCECGRGRPSACQYVLMLHIWFPNFPPTLPALPSAPLHRDVRTLFCFFSVEGREWWRGCVMSDGPEYRTTTFSLSSPLFFVLFLTIKSQRELNGYINEENEALFLCSPLFFTKSAAGHPHICWTKVRTTSFSSICSRKMSPTLFFY